MDIQNQEQANGGKKYLVMGSFALSLYFVVAVWNFWSEFINALGFNATLFILGVLALFFYSISDIKYIRKNLPWVIPVVLIAASFSMWENPFLKVVSVLALPVIFSIFFSYSFLPERKKIKIDFIILALFERIMLLAELNEAVKLVARRANFLKGEKSKIALRAVLGIMLFLVLAVTIFIPLLSSADPAFERLVSGFMKWIGDVISIRYFGRLVFAIVAGYFSISYFLSFNTDKLSKKDDLVSETEIKKSVDPIVSGIVLGGVLMLYVVFLTTQLSHLWVDRLPYEFKETERLVKSGFWQLFILSIINIIFFFGYFRRTNSTVQNILKAFTIASFLLLVSAGHRMFLYVFFYGLSYEKFFASYTVIYCVLVFIWLAYQLFANRAGDILKFLIFSLLWMYGVLTVLPVERMIFSVNANLSARSDSRIKLEELKMLSYDALPLVAIHRTDENWQNDWCTWGKSNISTVNKKKWYEKNLTNYSGVALPEKWRVGDCPEEKKTGNNPTKEDMQKDVLSLKEPVKETAWTYKNEDFSFELKYPKDGWRAVNYFDIDLNKVSGANLTKNDKTNIAILPGKYFARKKPAVRPVVSKIKIGDIDATKTLWKGKDGSGVLSIRLASYPSSWSASHSVEAIFGGETEEKEVDEILASLRFLK